MNEVEARELGRKYEIMKAGKRKKGMVEKIKGLIESERWDKIKALETYRKSNGALTWAGIGVDDSRNHTIKKMKEILKIVVEG